MARVAMSGVQHPCTIPLDFNQIWISMISTPPLTNSLHPPSIICDITVAQRTLRAPNFVGENWWGL